MKYKENTQILVKASAGTSEYYGFPAGTEFLATIREYNPLAKSYLVEDQDSDFFDIPETDIFPADED